jgi:hypothetical protein
MSTVQIDKATLERMLDLFELLNEANGGHWIVYNDDIDTFNGVETELRAALAAAPALLQAHTLPPPTQRDQWFYEQGRLAERDPRSHPSQAVEPDPDAMRYDFDGYGWSYIDGGSGSNWRARINGAEPLYAKKPKPAAPAKPCILSQEHSDNAAVDKFAAAMKEKLSQARDKGRGGWESCSEETLSKMLRDHVEKGDPRDVANFCMFIHTLGYRIAPAAPAKPEGYAKQLIEALYENGDPVSVDAAEWLEKQPTTPAKPLSDEQIFEIAETFGAFQYGDAQGFKRIAFARAIEAAHGIKETS